MKQDIYSGKENEQFRNELSKRLAEYAVELRDEVDQLKLDENANEGMGPNTSLTESKILDTYSSLEKFKEWIYSSLMTLSNNVKESKSIGSELWEFFFEWYDYTTTYHNFSFGDVFDDAEELIRDQAVEVIGGDSWDHDVKDF